MSSAITVGDYAGVTFRMEPARGRRQDSTYSPRDAWAARYPITQAAVERTRLLTGKAAHRAHRAPLPVKPQP